jgi:hypothetical protein
MEALHHRDGRCVTVTEPRDRDEKIAGGFSPYFKIAYHRDGGTKEVFSEAEWNELGTGWADSPAVHGVETHPSKSGPDLKIAERAPKKKAKE